MDNLQFRQHYYPGKYDLAEDDPDNHHRDDQQQTPVGLMDSMAMSPTAIPYLQWLGLGISDFGLVLCLVCWIRCYCVLTVIWINCTFYGVTEVEERIADLTTCFRSRLPHHCHVQTVINCYGSDLPNNPCKRKHTSVDLFLLLSISASQAK